MAVTQILLYNEALRVLKERKLASLAEARESRYILDDVFGFVFFVAVLEKGQWAFAMRTSQFDYSPSVEPPFGYRFAFNKPTDWVRTCAMCSDQYFRVPLNEMSDEAGFWYSDLQTLFVKYVSSDSQYGGNLALWPPSFTLFAAAWMAYQAVGSLTNSQVTKQDVEAEMNKRLMTALSMDAMSGPTKFPPPGSWTASRIGRGNPRQSLWNGQTWGG